MVGLTTIFRKFAGKIDEHGVAKQMYDYWRAPSPYRTIGYDHDGACAWIGNAKGETSLDVHAVGDHGHAFGFGQDHEDRAATIKWKSGIDVMSKDLTVLDALKAIDWESSHAIGTRHVCEHVMAADGLRAKVTVLVHEYERSGHQDTDIDKRTGYAQGISDMALSEQWNAKWDGVHT